MGSPEGSMTRRLLLEMADAVLAPLSRPVRALLVLLAYTLGVAALVGAIGVTQATTAKVVARLTDAASTELRVSDKATDGAQPWTQDDPTAAVAWTSSIVQARKLDEVEGVATATPVRQFTAVGNRIQRLPSASGDAPFTGRVLVAEARFLTLHRLDAASGDLSLLDAPWVGRAAVLGSTAAQSLAILEPGPGVDFTVNDRSVSVAAVLKPSGDAVADNTIFFTPASMTVLCDQLEGYWLIRADKGYAEPLAQAIPLALAPENPGRVTVSVVAELAQLQQGINSDLGALLAVIGSVILALSALTAGTTMFLSVQHREPEIALRRAMGASRPSIWRLVTYEGLLIGASGGILGTALGIVLTWAAAEVNGWPLSLGAGVVAVGVGVGSAAGIAASIIPALYAATREPAGILRTV